MERLRRFFYRSPIALYRLRLGGLLGGRFILLEHLGRRSGQWRTAVLEVVERADDGGVLIVSGFGAGSQWCRNLTANPGVWFTLGRDRTRATARRLDPDETEALLDRYRQTNPRAAKTLSSRIGTSLVDDLATAAEKLPAFHLVPDPADQPVGETP